MIKYFFIFLFTVSQAHAGFDPGPSSKTAIEAKESRAAKRESLYKYYAEQELAPPPVFPKVGMQDFFLTTISRMALKKDLANVSKNIMTESFQPWLPGTEIRVLGPFCKRAGDYDFIMMGLTIMAYMDEEANRTLLTEEARNKLRHVLLSQSGNEHYTRFKLKNCLPIEIRDSENHILMTETARYLKNQLLLKESIASGKRNDLYDNNKNGNEEWLLSHLSQFTRHEFDEFNSRPYQGYTLIALSVLHSYAEGERVKTLTKMLLDYLSAKAAIQSIGLRRYTPYRRNLNNRDPNHFAQEDSGMSWFTFHAGNHDYMDIAKNQKLETYLLEDYHYLMASVDKYEIPPMILEMFYNTQKPIMQRFFAKDPEVYFHSPNFLLTAGGRFRNVFDYFTGQANAWGVPTTIIGKSTGLSPKEVFSLKGEKNWGKRNNLCVAQNFACGKNLHIPNGPFIKTMQSNNWTFFETEDFNLAVYKVDEFALWEVQERGDLEAFANKVLERNKSDFNPKRVNTYVITNGDKITFNWNEKAIKKNSILAINGQKQKTLYRDWDLASGDVINSKGDGLITITSPFSKAQIILDDRDVMNPKRIEK